MRVVTTYWVNPLTGSHIMPTAPGDVLTAAIAYWEDQLNEQRASRPRTPAGKEAKEALSQKACDRLQRFRKARDLYAMDVRKLDKLSLTLATEDLAAVMKSTVERAA